MRILVVAPDDPHIRSYPESIFEELKNFCNGYEFEMIMMNTFNLNCTYIQKRMYKLGYKAAEINYDKKLIFELEKKCSQFQPQCILILNGMQVPVAVQNFLTRYKVLLWLWDSFRGGI